MTSTSLVRTKAVAVPPGARLSFRHYYYFESCCDGGVLEYSTNGGTAWTDALPLHVGGATYAAPVLSGSSSLAGRRVFTASPGTYGASLYDLSSLAGQSVRFQFLIATDNESERPRFDGWFIDDVHVFTCSPGGVVALSAASFAAGEASPTATVTIVRTSGQADGVTVAYRTVDGTATAGEDYAATSGTVYFGSGVMSRTFTVPILNDTIVDPDEAFQVEVELIDGPGASLGAQSVATVSIADNDVAGTLKFGAAVYSVAETSPVATITVTRTGGTASGVTVDYAASNGTAVASGDYSPTSGTLTFGAGEMSQTFTVPIVNDTLDEPNETINLALSNPDGGGSLAAPSAATLTVVDNDIAGAIKLGAAAYSVSESGPVATITVTRSGGTASGVTVDYATGGGSAAAGSDYTTTSGTLNFGAGQLSQVITVPILDDDIGENNETFVTSLSVPTGGATLAVPSAATVTILENEAVLQFAAASYAVVEGAPTALITVKRTGLLSVAATVDYTVSAGSASAGSDFTAGGGTLAFAAGVAARTFTVAIANDATSEGPETVLLSLGNPLGSGALGPQSTSVLTIADNGALFDFSAAAYSIGEATAFATITVQRTGVTTGTVGVDYAASNGSAGPGDYGAAAGTLSFAPGVKSRTFTVPIVNDPDAEPTETVNLTLGAPTGEAALGSRSSAVLSILDNDPRLAFSAAAYSVGEATALATITVKRTGSPLGTVGVTYTASNGSASSGSDYGATTGTLTFAPGVLSGTFTVPIINDGSGEGNETVNLVLENPTGGAGLGTPAAAVLTILDNEPLFKFSAATYSLSEAGVNATITVQRLGLASAYVSVGYATSNGTATAGSDYTATSGSSLSFAPGVLSRTFTVPITNDLDGEGNETVNLTLSDPSTGAGLGTPSTAVLTILDNEPLLQFSAAAYTVSETGPVATITVKRVGSTAGTVGVTFATGGGTATAGSDYTATSGTLSFKPGATAMKFTVPIANDTADDEAETIVLTLSSATGGAGLGAPSTAVVTITDNDVAGAIQFGAATFSVSESAGTATITVTRTGGTASAASVVFATSDGTAVDDSDYTGTTGTVTFAAGAVSATFTVDVEDDAAAEGNEFLNLTLSNPGGGATLGAQSTAKLYLVE